MELARQLVRLAHCIIVGNMIKIIAYIACVPFAIFFDWGIYTRISLNFMILENLKKIKDNSSTDYKKYIFPRIFVTIFSAPAFCYDAFRSGGGRIFAWIGVALFLSSLSYAILRAHVFPDRDRS